MCARAVCHESFFSALRVPALAKAAQRAAFSAFFSAAPEAAALGAAGAGVPTIAPNDFGFGFAVW